MSLHHIEVENDNKGLALQHELTVYHSVNASLSRSFGLGNAVVVADLPDDFDFSKLETPIKEHHAAILLPAPSATTEDKPAETSEPEADHDESTTEQTDTVPTERA